MPSNFSVLAPLSPDLAKLGHKAESYFCTDPNTVLLKLRQFGELLAQEVAARFGLRDTGTSESQLELLKRLDQAGALSTDIKQLFHNLRKAGNDANHALVGDHRTALENLKLARQLGLWFYRTFRDPDYAGGPFIPPQAPPDPTQGLTQEIADLQAQLKTYQAQLSAMQAEAGTAQELALQAQQEAQIWADLASEAEKSKEELQTSLDTLQAQAKSTAPTAIKTFLQQAQKAAQQVELDEAATRVIIDEQLRAAGWEVDSVVLHYAKGARPEVGRSRAISEWPTVSGPADYALFLGLDLVGTVEAKRANKHVYGAIEQAKRYSRDIKPVDCKLTGGPWGVYQVPFVFSSNGRPYLNQLKEYSGTWFCDLRRPQNLSKPLDGWYSPQGLKELLKQDLDTAEGKLESLGFAYGFEVRDYQRKAIQAVEDAIKAGQTTCLVAMAGACQGHLRCEGWSTHRFRSSASTASRTRPESAWRAAEGPELHILQAQQCSANQPAARTVAQWVAATPHADTLLAIDAPLGWPEALGRALTQHRAGDPIKP